MRLGCITLLLVAAIGGGGLHAAAQDGACTFDVAAAREIGVVAQPASVTTRDGGATALIGDKLLWTFGDTLFTPKSEDGTNLRSNTAALADPAAPLVLDEPLDSQGAPYQFLAFAPDEKAYNDSTGKHDDRIALWPVSVIADSDTTGLVFYLKLKIKPGVFNFYFFGIGLARLEAGKTVAVRDSGLLFDGFPLFDSAMVVGSDVYIYGGIFDGSNTQPLGLAKVPLKQVRDRSVWRFWSGKDWVSDFHRAAAIVRGVPGAASVSYNACLKEYLMVYTQGFTNNVLMRIALRPEGPWSEPLKAFTGIVPTEGADYAAREHPELASDGGRTVAITYYHPRGSLKGEMRLVNVTFK